MAERLTDEINRLYKIKLNKYKIEELTEEQKKHIFSELYVEAVTEVMASEMTLKGVCV